MQEDANFLSLKKKQLRLRDILISYFYGMGLLSFRPGRLMLFIQVGDLFS